MRQSNRPHDNSVNWLATETQHTSISIFRFGVLALDEPTTNLDEENVKYLCMALNEIVQDRMSQKNFMFIIITHDKEFINSLGHIDQVSHYYEVSRNGEGKSEVKKVCFS